MGGFRLVSAWLVGGAPTYFRDRGLLANCFIGGFWGGFSPTVDREAGARSAENRWVFHPSPTARCYTKLGGYFTKMRHCGLEVPGAHPDRDSFLDVKKVPTSKQEMSTIFCDKRG